ncbi:PEP/pyruvate-binding domain-containing protein [Bacterioplanoides pacificum]|uniref:PEP/pyruvate-binding domain-containing protein n=1 Tax=Bacterioplanoides pacificum TaxID=1171596 RepID=A0ABV7VR68_9GAMM
MFTANPVNGDRRQALISSTWGCGEGLVSGVCNADEITVGLYDNSINTQTADKDIALRQCPDGGCGVSIVAAGVVAGGTLAVCRTFIIVCRGDCRVGLYVRRVAQFTG